VPPEIAPSIGKGKCSLNIPTPFLRPACLPPSPAPLHQHGVRP